MKKMCWFIYREDFNNRKIERYDIFRHGSFAEDVKKIYKKHKDDFETFSKEVNNSLRYYFWSKCEWEIIISDWPPSTKEKVEVKVDVYDQVMLNWNIFIKYVWEQAHKRKNAKD